MNYRRIYIPNSKVFITVVTNNRVQILKGREALLLSSIKDASNYYDFEVDCFSILHDHFHLILSMKNILDYPKIIHSIKYNFTKNVGVATPTYILYNINFHFTQKNGTSKIPVPFFII